MTKISATFWFDLVYAVAFSIIRKYMIFRKIFDEIFSLIIFFVISHSIFVNYRNVEILFLSLKLLQKDKFDLNIINDVDNVDTTEVDTITELKDEKE